RPPAISSSSIRRRESPDCVICRCCADFDKLPKSAMASMASRWRIRSLPLNGVMPDYSSGFARHAAAPLPGSGMAWIDDCDASLAPQPFDLTRSKPEKRRYPVRDSAQPFRHFRDVHDVTEILDEAG